MANKTKNNQKIIIGNWKMKNDFNESIKLVKSLKDKFKKFSKQEIVVCPDFVALRSVKRQLSGTSIKLGAQNVFWEDQGSFTGEVSPLTLRQVGCEYVIIGHSERREHLLENYSMIHQKVKETLNTQDLTPIVCVGETIEEKKSDKRDSVLLDQLQQALGGSRIMEGQQIIVAYEPVWAIGSGMPIKIKEVKYAHKIIRLVLNDMFGIATVNDYFKIIYGGSVNSSNVKDFAEVDNIDGLLLGGASLQAEEFYEVANNILK